MPDAQQIFSVLKKPGDSCAILQLQSAADASGNKIEFWVEVGQVSAGYAMAQSICDRMNQPARAPRKATT